MFRARALKAAGEMLSFNATIPLLAPGWLIGVLFFVGCATVPPKQILSDLEARRPPDVALGEPMRLLEQPVGQATAVASADGRLHLFALDTAKTLHHVQVDGEQVIKRSRIGTVDGAPADVTLDVVEWPVGTLRVLAGGRQFVGSPGGEWQSLEGNRCQHFLVLSDKLYCAYVAKGEEIGSPKRTDVYAGLLFIVPFVLPVDRASQKLVLAEFTTGTWTARAVVDPDDSLDAASDFAMGVDGQGDLHILYKVSRGGGLILLGPMGGGAGALPEPKLSYARLAIASLASNRDAAVGGSAFTPIRGQYLGLPYATQYGDEPAWFTLEPIRARFAINRATGTVDGLVRGPEVRLTPESVAYRFGALSEAVVDVSLREAVWQVPAQIVLTSNWPDTGVEYLWWGRPAMLIDADGTSHALFASGKDCFLSCKAYGLDYLAKRSGAWSAPKRFSTGRMEFWSLFKGQAGVFAAWAEKGGGLLGRWIFPKS